jgi:hypothetical protein
LGEEFQTDIDTTPAVFVVCLVELAFWEVFPVKNRYIPNYVPLRCIW